MMKLYDGHHSPNARKCRAVLAEIGLEVDAIEVDLLGGETRSAAFRALNPLGKVPVLVDGDLVLWESNAICGYVAALRPQAGLHPRDPRERAEVERWLFWQLGSFARPLQRAAFQRVVRPALRGEPPDEAVVAEAMREATPLLELLDERLRSRPWLVDRLSLADFAVGSWAELGREARLLDPFAHVLAWLDRLEARPSWASTRNHPFPAHRSAAE